MLDRLPDLVNGNAALVRRGRYLNTTFMVEVGPQQQLFRSAAHPYTRRLVQAIPDLSGRYALEGIPGRAPAPGHRPSGCFFVPRCDFRTQDDVDVS